MGERSRCRSDRSKHIHLIMLLVGNIHLASEGVIIPWAKRTTSEQGGEYLSCAKVNGINIPQTCGDIDCDTIRNTHILWTTRNGNAGKLFACIVIDAERTASSDPELIATATGRTGADNRHCQSIHWPIRCNSMLDRTVGGIECSDTSCSIPCCIE